MDSDEALDTTGFSHTVTGLALEIDEGVNGEVSLKVLLVKNLGDKKKKGFAQNSREGREGKPLGYGLPTGGVEKCESLEAAIKRECKDESGFDLRRIFCKFAEYHKPQIKNVVHAFFIEVDDLQGPVKEKEEIDNKDHPPRWVSIEEMLAMPGTAESAPNSLYDSHLQRTLDFLEVVVDTKPENIAKIPDAQLKKWLTRYAPLVQRKMAELVAKGALGMKSI